MSCRTAGASGYGVFGSVGRTAAWALMLLAMGCAGAALDGTADEEPYGDTLMSCSGTSCTDFAVEGTGEVFANRLWSDAAQSGLAWGEWSAFTGDTEYAAQELRSLLAALFPDVEVLPDLSPVDECEVPESRDDMMSAYDAAETGAQVGDGTGQVRDVTGDCGGLEGAG